MADFYEIDHPCVPYMKVPVYGRPPAPAVPDETTTLSENTAGMLAYILSDFNSIDKAA